MDIGIMLMSDRGPDGQPMDWRRFLAECRTHGLEKVDLFDRMIAAVGETPGSMGRLLADLGLSPSVYAVPTDLVSPDPAARRAALDTVRRGLDACEALGLRHLFSHGGQHNNKGEEALKRYADGLAQAADLAAARSMILSIENAGSLCHVAAEIARCRDLAGRPNLKVTLDGGNFILAGDDPHEAACRLADCVVHVHAKAFVSAPERQPRPFRYCPVGEGLVDYRRILTTLAASGFNGCVSFEPEGGHDSKWMQSLDAVTSLVREFRSWRR